MLPQVLSLSMSIVYLFTQRSLRDVCHGVLFLINPNINFPCEIAFFPSQKTSIYFKVDFIHGGLDLQISLSLRTSLPFDSIGFERTLVVSFLLRGARALSQYHRERQQKMKFGQLTLLLPCQAYRGPYQARGTQDQT